MLERKICLAILGPTASGKTEFAIQTAKAIDGEIVCVDSTTVYKGFDIGTSKPTQKQREQIRHHLIDILEPEQAFNARDFVESAKTCIEEIHSRGKTPILVGGSYFYLRALQVGMYPTGGYDEGLLETLAEEFSEGEGLNGEKLHSALLQIDPVSAAALHPNDTYRLLRAMALVRSGKQPSSLKPVEVLGPEWLWVKYAMTLSRNLLADNILARTQRMVDEGLVDEVRKLSIQFPKAKALGSIGYAETLRFLRNEITKETLIQSISENTRQLLKRQVTWLRGDPEVRFIDSGDLPRLELEISNLRAVLRGEG